jgi:ankyrin repeat protein
MAPKTDLASYAFYCAPGALRSALKKHGANPNQTDSDTNKTPLMWLCEMHDKHTRSRKRMFRALVRAGAQLDARDINGLTAWDYAKLGAARGFRAFVRAEYQRIMGSAVSKDLHQAESLGVTQRAQ